MRSPTSFRGTTPPAARQKCVRHPNGLSRYIVHRPSFPNNGQAPSACGFNSRRPLALTPRAATSASPKVNTGTSPVS